MYVYFCVLLNVNYLYTMRVYTRSGDKGTTTLYGGVRVAKNDIRVDCYGTFDEVNSFIGLLRAKLDIGHLWHNNLYKIQGDLMDIMSHLATPPNANKINSRSHPTDLAQFCESWIDAMHKEMGELSKNFLLPGGTEISALCHVVRTQCRRAERKLTTLHQQSAVADYILESVNRLSDLFFVLARYELYTNNVDEEKWIAFRSKTQ